MTGRVINGTLCKCKTGTAWRICLNGPGRGGRRGCGVIAEAVEELDWEV
jgi:hypothetical protein